MPLTQLKKKRKKEEKKKKERTRRKRREGRLFGKKGRLHRFPAWCDKTAIPLEKGKKINERKRKERGATSWGVFIGLTKREKKKGGEEEG